MFCKECGAQYENAKFCPECGTQTNNFMPAQNPQPFSQPPPSTSTPMNPTNTNISPLQSTPPILCPVDGINGSLQRVSALVLAGNASGVFKGPSGGVTYSDGNVGYYGGATTLQGSLTTDIAKMLAPPPPPKAISFWSLLGWSALMYISLGILIGPFLVWPAFKKSMVHDPQKREEVFAGVSVGCFIALLFGVFYCVSLIPLYKMLVKRSEYPRRNQQWHEATAKWEKLYYCHRCGIVLNPETNEQFQPNQLYDYLNIAAYYHL